MKSKISCWRLVRSMSVQLPNRLEWGLKRTCVRTVARGEDGGQPRFPGDVSVWSRSYTRPLCACGGIGRRARLRALWTVWSVEVRVLSGASKKPCYDHRLACVDAPLGPALISSDEDV